MSTLKIRENSSSPWQSIPTGGVGVPAGGTTGQFLIKSSNTDYADEWATIEADDIGAMAEWDLLWENASPTSSFPATPVTISNILNYDFIAVEADQNVNSDTRNRFITIAKVDSYNHRMFLLTRANTPGIQLRDFTISASVVNFETGYTGATAGTNYAVPISVYGIKGVNRQ